MPDTGKMKKHELLFCLSSVFLEAYSCTWPDSFCSKRS